MRRKDFCDVMRNNPDDEIRRLWRRFQETDNPLDLEKYLRYKARSMPWYQCRICEEIRQDEDYQGLCPSCAKDQDDRRQSAEEYANRPNPDGDAYLRLLKRQASLGDSRAHQRLRLELARRGQQDKRVPVTRHWVKLSQEIDTAHRLYDEAEYQWTGLQWNIDPYSFACKAHRDPYDDAIAWDNECPRCQSNLDDYRRQVEGQADAARDAARRALVALDQGDFQQAQILAAEASEIENQYGDDPTWNAFARQVEKIAEGLT